MKTGLEILGLLLAAMTGHAIELESIPYKVVAENRTFVRDATDRRYSVWTDAPTQVEKLMKAFALSEEEPIHLQKGKIFAVFLNDRIIENLVQITYNKTTGKIFADYVDSGMRLKLKAPGEGKKYSHLTAIVFTPPMTPSHLGIRGMIADGLSEKITDP